MLYLLLCIVLGAGLVGLRQLRDGIGSPPTIWLASLLLCSAAAFVAQFLWDDLPLNIDVFLVIAVAAITFTAVSTVIIGALQKPGQGGAVGISSKWENPLPAWCLVAVSLFAIATLFVYSHDVQAILRNYGSDSSGLMQVIASYREFTIQSAQGQISGDYGKISFVASVMYRALEVVIVFVVANFIFMTSANRRRLWPLYGLTVIIVCAAMFLTGGSRSPIVHFAIAVIVLIAFGYDRSGKVVNLGVALRWCGVAVLVLVLFTAASVVRGEEMRSGLVGYLSFFLGSGLTSFNYMVSEGLLSQSPETFSALWDLLSKVVEIPRAGDAEQLWIDYPGNSSNVFTGFSGFYADCGLLGVTAYCGILGVVYSLLYVKATPSNAPGYTVAYCFFAYALFDVIRADALSSLVGIPLIEYVFFIVVIGWAYRAILGSRDLLRAAKDS